MINDRLNEGQWEHQLFSFFVVIGFGLFHNSLKYPELYCKGATLQKFLTQYL